MVSCLELCEAVMDFLSAQFNPSLPSMETRTKTFGFLWIYTHGIDQKVPGPPGPWDHLGKPLG